MKHFSSLIVLLMFSCIWTYAQTIKQLVVEPATEDGFSLFTKSCLPENGVLVFKTAIQDLKFELNINNTSLKQSYNKERNEYVLCVEPRRRYTVTILGDDYEAVDTTIIDIKANEPRFFRIQPKETIVLTDTIRNVITETVTVTDTITNVITETVTVTDTITNVVKETVMLTDTITEVVTKTQVVRERIVVPKIVTREEIVKYQHNLFITLHAGLAIPVGKFGSTDPEEFLPERLQIGSGSQGGAKLGSSFGVRVSEYNENFGMFLDYNCTFNRINSKIYDYYSLSDVNGNKVEMVRNFRYNNHSIMAGVNFFIDIHGNLGFFCEFGGGLNIFHMRDIEYTNDKSTSFKFTENMNVPIAMKIAVEAGGGLTFFQRRMYIGVYYKNMGNYKVYIVDKNHRPLRLKVDMLNIRIGVLFDIFN